MMGELKLLAKRVLLDRVIVWVPFKSIIEAVADVGLAQKEMVFRPVMVGEIEAVSSVPSNWRQEPEIQELPLTQAGAEEPVPRELAMRYDELLAYYDEFRRGKDREKREAVVSSKNEAKNGARLKLSQILESEMKSRFK